MNVYHQAKMSLRQYLSFTQLWRWILPLAYIGQTASKCTLPDGSDDGKGAVFLTQKIQDRGFLVAFDAYFGHASWPVSLQVWRPVGSNKYCVNGTYAIQPTSELGMTEVHEKDLLRKQSMRVYSGDRLGIKIRETPDSRIQFDHQFSVAATIKPPDHAECKCPNDDDRFCAKSGDPTLNSESARETGGKADGPDDGKGGGFLTQEIQKPGILVDFDGYFGHASWSVSLELWRRDNYSDCSNYSVKDTDTIPRDTTFKYGLTENYILKLPEKNSVQVKVGDRLGIRIQEATQPPACGTGSGSWQHTKSEEESRIQFRHQFFAAATIKPADDYSSCFCEMGRERFSSLSRRGNIVVGTKRRKVKVDVGRERRAKCDSTLIGDDPHLATDVGPVDSQESATLNDASQYVKRRQRRVSEWQDSRELLIASLKERKAPATDTCLLCQQSTPNVIRCLDCGTAAMFCRACYDRQHVLFAAYHTAEIWHGNLFVPYVLQGIRLVSSLHECKSCYQRTVILIQPNGSQHKSVVQFCHTEPETVTLCRLGYWPGSPKEPKVAFSLELLSMYRALLLEGHLSVQAFVKAMEVHRKEQSPICALLTSEIKDLYKVLVGDTIQEYFHAAYVMRQCAHDKGNQCFACPENGPNVVSVDANFGLVRRKASGTCLSHPLRRGLFFTSQDEVDTFVNGYQTLSKKGSGDCNDFQAGDDLRSKSRTKKLDETAVFGSICRHEFPQTFFSLKHGERLSYAVYLLQLLKSRRGGNMTLLYDIACILDVHLKKNNPELLRDVILAIPIFHCYGHKMSCQMKYSPRCIGGLGLVDGEGMERLWSYLRRFSTISKEMTPDRRIDLLSEALLHYGSRKNENLRSTIRMKMLKTCNMKRATEEDLKALLSLGVHRDDVKRWRDEMRCQADKPGAVALSKEHEYVLKLDYFFKLKDAVEQEDGTEESRSEKLCELDILDAKLAKTERQIKKERPCQTSATFKDHLSEATAKERIRLLSEARAKATERQYLQILMKKYAKGQAIAGKLTRKISLLSKAMAKLQGSLIQLTGETAELSEMYNLESSLFNSLDVCTSPVPLSLRKRAVDALCLLERTEEEEELLRADLLQAIDRIKLIKSAAQEACCDAIDRSSRGNKAHLWEQIFMYETLLLDLSLLANELDIDVAPVTDVRDSVCHLLDSLAEQSAPLEMANLHVVDDALIEDDPHIADMLQVLDSVHGLYEDSDESDDDTDSS